MTWVGPGIETGIRRHRFRCSCSLCNSQEAERNDAPDRSRGQRLRGTIVDCAFKAEETNTGHIVPTQLRFRGTGAFHEGCGRIASA